MTLQHAREKIERIEQELQAMKQQREQDTSSFGVYNQPQVAVSTIEQAEPNGQDCTVQPRCKSPPRKRVKFSEEFDEEWRPKVDADSHIQEQNMDVVGYGEAEYLRVGPCNSCERVGVECLRTIKSVKNGITEWGRCEFCIVAHNPCVWGDNGRIRFQPRMDRSRQTKGQTSVKKPVKPPVNERSEPLKPKPMVHSDEPQPQAPPSTLFLAAITDLRTEMIQAQALALDPQQGFVALGGKNELDLFYGKN